MSKNSEAQNISTPTSTNAEYEPHSWNEATKIESKTLVEEAFEAGTCVINLAELQEEDKPPAAVNVSNEPVPTQVPSADEFKASVVDQKFAEPGTEAENASPRNWRKIFLLGSLALIGPLFFYQMNKPAFTVDEVRAQKESASTAVGTKSVSVVDAKPAEVVRIAEKPQLPQLEPKKVETSANSINSLFEQYDQAFLKTQAKVRQGKLVD